LAFSWVGSVGRNPLAAADHPGFDHVTTIQNAATLIGIRRHPFLLDAVVQFRG
jgi:hypothetical protein